MIRAILAYLFRDDDGLPVLTPPVDHEPSYWETVTLPATLGRMVDLSRW